MPRTTDADKTDDQILDALGDEDVVIPFRYSITSYGADYPVDALVKRVSNGSIYIPDFQRDYVWTRPQASKFIESLLLGFPVPGIFLAKDPDSSKLSVIDGLQRLQTLRYFYGGTLPYNDRTFRLTGVQEEFEGLTYQELPEDDRIHLDDFIIHATVVKQDEPTDDQSSIYYLFERINTGGTSLSAQEIRTCLYFGDFTNLLAKLNELENWRRIFGRRSKRMRDIELILRFFAMLLHRNEYDRPMRSFLNRVLSGSRHLSPQQQSDLTEIFSSTINLIHNALGKKAFKPRGNLNAAVFDSIMVGVAERLRSPGSRPRASTIKSRYQEITSNEKYLKAVTNATADRDMVEVRMDEAIATFSR